MQFRSCIIWFYQAQNSCPQCQVPFEQFNAYEAKSNLFALTYFCYSSLQILWKMNTTIFFPKIGTDRFTLSENNFSLSQFLQIK